MMSKTERPAPQAAGPPQDQIDRLLQLFNQGRFESVIEQAQESAERFPDSFAIWNILGAGFGARGQHTEAEAAFRKSTDLNPTSYAAFRNLGGACQQQGKLDEAIDAFGKALAIMPDDAEAHLNLAKAHQRKGDLDEAVAGFGRFLAIRPDHAETQIIQGNLLRQQGEPDKAIAAFKIAISLRPDDAKAYGDLGAVLRDKGELEGAIDAYRKALSIKPNSPEALVGMGLALHGQENWSGAVDAYRKALAIKPDHARAHNNMGVALKEQGKTEEAVEAYRNAISVEPDYAGAHTNLGAALTEQGRLEEAVEACIKALSIDPDSPEAHLNLGNALHGQEDWGGAVDAFRQVLSIKPEDAGTYNNMGVALKDQGRLEEALEALQKALSLKPDYADAYSNMGVALKEQGKPEQAVEAYRKALSIKPDYGQAKHNLGLAKLFQGDIESGFEFLEFRCTKPNAKTRPARPEFVWDRMTSLKGKRFYVYDEQGIGDMFQFVRYLPLLAERGAEVSFETKTRFHRVLQSSDLRARLVSDPPAQDRIDYEAPLMSLPHLLGTGLDTIPAPSPYLQADEGKVESWARLRDDHSLTVGICWQGSKARVDVGRSFPLSLFEGMSKIPGIRLVSLHKGAGEDQLDTIPFDVTRPGSDLDAGPDAFVDSAAVMMHCDLVITSDTAVAHLAGALGRPTWVALKHVPDWRWMMDRADSPWYPTMVLYRQTTRGDWDGVFARMEQDLRVLSASAVRKPLRLALTSWVKRRMRGPSRP